LGSSQVAPGIALPASSYLSQLAEIKEDFPANGGLPILSENEQPAQNPSEST
jgi:hypothetical protein